MGTTGATLGLPSFIPDFTKPFEGLGLPALAKKDEGRTIYVLHSGMRDPENDAALSLKKALTKRGVKDKDIVVMPAVYPAMVLDPTSKKFGDGVKDNLAIFGKSADKDSEVVQKQYKFYQDALKKAGAKPGDKIVWVGDSAGGQMGFTLAKVAKDKKTFPMHTIVTLGSPIAKNEVPPEVQIRHYTSESDQIQHGKLLGGQVGKPIPDNLDGNNRVRWFRRIGHCDWYKDSDPAIVDRILTETQPEKPNPLLALAAIPIPGTQLGGMIPLGIAQRHTIENNKGLDVTDNATTVDIGGFKIDALSTIDGLGKLFQKKK